MKILSAFCDLHPSDKLAQRSIKIPTWHDEQATLRCTHSACDRHFHYDFGYFPFTAGEEPDFGELNAKPRCRLKHDLLYMLLTEIDGVPVYACFHPDCTITIPYVAQK